MITPNVTVTQSQFHEPIERSTPRSDTLALKVTAVALGILISMSAFALVGPIEGIIVTTIVCVALITLFNENTGSKNMTGPPSMYFMVSMMFFVLKPLVLKLVK